MGDKVGENPAALRAAVFFAILEKPDGGAFKRPPPPSRARVKVSLRLSYGSGDHETKWDDITRLDTLVRKTNAIHLERNRSCTTTLVRVWRSPATAPVIRWTPARCWTDPGNGCRLHGFGPSMAWAGVGMYPHSREQPSGRLSICRFLPSLLI